MKSYIQTNPSAVNGVSQRGLPGSQETVLLCYVQVACGLCFLIVRTKCDKEPKECVLITQLCPTLCDPMDCSLPHSSFHRLVQARILEWVAIPFFRGSSHPRD